MHDTDTTVRNVPYHEAAHAVCARLLGLTVTRVEVFAEGGTTGVGTPPWMPADERRLRMAAVAFAGPTAEALALGVPTESVASFAEDARSALRYAPADPDARAAFVEEAALRADRVVRDPRARDEIARLAGLLARAGAAYPDLHRFAWAASQTSRNTVKAVWTGPGQRRDLYGAAAKKALASP